MCDVLTLFDIYIELLARIRVSEKGVEVGNRRLSCLSYADDIVLMAERKQDVEELLQVASTMDKSGVLDTMTGNVR